MEKPKHNIYMHTTDAHLTNTKKTVTFRYSVSHHNWITNYFVSATQLPRWKTISSPKLEQTRWNLLTHIVHYNTYNNASKISYSNWERRFHHRQRCASMTEYWKFPLNWKPISCVIKTNCGCRFRNLFIFYCIFVVQIHAFS